MDFTLSAPKTLIAAGVPATVTITLTGPGALVVDSTFVGSAGSSAIPNILAGSVAGDSTVFTFTATESGVLSVTSAGDFATTQTLAFTVPIARSTTATRILKQALGVLGVYPPGQEIDGDELDDLLQRLNTMVDGWRTSALYAYASETITGIIPANAKTVTIGPSGDIVTMYRPLRVESGSYFTNSGMDFSVQSITGPEFAGIGYKTMSTLGPDGLFYEPTLPNGTLYLYPQASSNTLITLQTLMEISEFIDLTTAYVLAPGYEMALVYSFAEVIAPAYERQASPSVAKSAFLARRNIERANHVTPALSGYRSRGNILVGWEN